MDYYVEAASPELACAALRAERRILAGPITVVERLPPGDAAAVRSEGAWISRISSA